jgi:hypothetical protein
VFDSHQHVIGFQASLDNEETSVCMFSIADALVCAALIDEYTLTFSEAARLLNQTGYYLVEHAQYAQAEPLYQRALAFCEKRLGAEHPETRIVQGNYTDLLQKRKDKRKQYN